MNATKAKELLLPIPKEEFIISRYSKGGKCCAIGHLVRLSSKDPNDYSLANCEDGYPFEEQINTFARIDVSKFLKEKHSQYGDLATVNNYNQVNGYNQDNPKDRVIALLDDMIKEEL